MDKGNTLILRVKLMNWLRIISAVISIGIFLYLTFQSYRFHKELKKETNNDDRGLSRRFARKWERELSKKSTILIIIGTIFGILFYIGDLF